MATIASTTTSGVQLPGGGMTLDALMLRQKALAEAKGRIAAPRQIQHPLQGLAQMAESFFNARAEASAADDLAAGRSRLAELMAKIDASGGTVDPAISAELYALDPDVGLQIRSEVAQARREAEARRIHEAERAQDRSWALADQGSQRAFTSAQQEDQQAASVDAATTAYERSVDAAEASRRAAADAAAAQAALPKDEAAQAYDAYNRGQYGAVGSPEAQQALQLRLAKINNISGGLSVETSFDEQGRPITTMTTGGTGGTAGANQVAKNVANAREDYRVAAKAANDLLPVIGNMQKAYNSAGYTGPGGDYVGLFDDALEAVGLPSLPGSSGSRAIVRGGGLGFIMDAVSKSKGSISDKETALFQAASPGLSTTKEGAEMMLGIAEQVARRSIERDARAQQWAGEHGTLDGFEQEWANYINANPIIVETPDGGIALAGKAPAATSAAPAAGGLPAGVTEEDIAETMRVNSMTRQQVLDALAARTRGGTNGGP